MVILSVLIIIVFGIIFWQDYKDRLVHWFLYPLFGIIGLGIQYMQTRTLLTISLNIIMNLIMILTIISILFFYSTFIAKKKFYNHSIGSGDLLFFICLCFIFPADVFLLLFPFSILSSLLLHLFLKRQYKKQTSVPLAGYMALFFAFVFLISLKSNFHDYSITHFLYGI